MKETKDITEAARQVEGLVNDHLESGADVEGLALTMMGAAAQLLTGAWGAPRVLAAFDVLVEGAASRPVAD